MLNVASIVVAALFVLAPQIPSSLLVLDNREPIPYFIEDGKGVPGYRDSDRELAKLALDAWSRESGGKLKFSEIKIEQSAVLRFRWISPNEGLYGETQRVQVSGKRGAIVNVMTQVSVQGEPLAGRAIQDNL